MEMKKVVKVGGAFARKEPYEYEGSKFEADIKNGDTVKITTAGTVVTGQFGDQHVFGIQTRNGEKNMTFNQKTINILVDEFGADSTKWAGKEVNVLLHKTLIAGKKCTVAYLVTPGWTLDEYGELVKVGEQPTIGNTGVPYPEEEINSEDIPF